MRPIISPMIVPKNSAIARPCAIARSVAPAASRNAALVIVGQNTAMMPVGRATNGGRPQAHRQLPCKEDREARDQTRHEFGRKAARAHARLRGDARLRHCKPLQAANLFSSARPMPMSSTPRMVMIRIAA